MELLEARHTVVQTISELLAVYLHTLVSFLHLAVFEQWFHT
jgi:hypothetical protein